MTDEQIFNKLEKTYETEGGKKFISHLIRSFYPVSNSTFIEDSKGKNLKCCITDQKLLGREDIFKKLFEVKPLEFSEYLRDSLDPEKKTEHPLRAKMDGHILGIECKNSDKVLSKAAFDQIYNFYATKILANDSNMVWLGKQITGQGRPKKRKPAQAQVKRATTSLGDFEALKNLKTKMENEKVDKA